MPSGHCCASLLPKRANASPLRSSNPPEMTSPSSDKASPQYLVLAQVLRPHGIRGDLSIKMLTDFPERMKELDVVYLGADPEKPRNLVKQHVVWVRRAKN